MELNWKQQPYTDRCHTLFTNTHANLLSGAIQAQKPAYCEKPIDLNISRVKAVVTGESQAQRISPISCLLTRAGWFGKTRTP